MSQQLSEREALELADRLKSHEVLVEKLGFYANQAQNPELSHMLRQHQQIYSRHYSEMLSVIEQAQQGGYNP